MLNLSPELLRPNTNNPGKDVVPSGGRDPRGEVEFQSNRLAAVGQLGVWVGTAINSMCREIREKLSILRVAPNSSSNASPAVLSTFLFCPSQSGKKKKPKALGTAVCWGRHALGAVCKELHLQDPKPQLLLPPPGAAFHPLGLLHQDGAGLRWGAGCKGCVRSNQLGVRTSARGSSKAPAATQPSQRIRAAGPRLPSSRQGVKSKKEGAAELDRCLQGSFLRSPPPYGSSRSPRSPWCPPTSRVGARSLAGGFPRQLLPLCCRSCSSPDLFFPTLSMPKRSQLRGWRSGSRVLAPRVPSAAPESFSPSAPSNASHAAGALCTPGEDFVCS